MPFSELDAGESAPEAPKDTAKDVGEKKVESPEAGEETSRLEKAIVDTEVVIEKEVAVEDCEDTQKSFEKVIVAPFAAAVAETPPPVSETGESSAGSEEVEFSGGTREGGDDSGADIVSTKPVGEKESDSLPSVNKVVVRIDGGGDDEVDSGSGTESDSVSSGTETSESGKPVDEDLFPSTRIQTSYSKGESTSAKFSNANTEIIVEGTVTEPETEKPELDISTSSLSEKIDTARDAVTEDPTPNQEFTDQWIRSESSASQTEREPELDPMDKLSGEQVHRDDTEVEISPAGLRKFKKNTSFLISDKLEGELKKNKKITFGDLVLSVLPWPFHKDLPDPAINEGRDFTTSLTLKQAMNNNSNFYEIFRWWHYLGKSDDSSSMSESDSSGDGDTDAETVENMREYSKDTREDHDELLKQILESFQNFVEVMKDYSQRERDTQNKLDESSKH